MNPTPTQERHSPRQEAPGAAATLQAGQGRGEGLLGTTPLWARARAEAAPRPRAGRRTWTLANPRPPGQTLEMALRDAQRDGEEARLVLTRRLHRQWAGPEQERRYRRARAWRRQRRLQAQEALR